MKKSSEKPLKTQEGFDLKMRRRPATPLSLQVPVDVLASLKRIAANRDMSVDALVKLYVGQGLRQDLAKLFGDRVLETTAQVLTRHIESEEEISAILKEIRGEATA